MVRTGRSAALALIAALVVVGCSSGDGDAAGSGTAADTAAGEASDDDASDGDELAEDDASTDEDTGSGDDAAGQAADGPFEMVVTDRFEISGGGIVVTGQVSSGTVRVGDGVCVVTDAGTLQTTVTGLESFNELIDEASAGDNIGAQLDGVTLEEVETASALNSC